MNRQIWNSQNGAEITMPARKAILSRISAPPNTSVMSRAQSDPDPPSARCEEGTAQYGARMNAPSPWSYHQKQTAVATATNSTASATRLRNSRRCAIRVIVASGSRGGRRLRPDVLTGEPSWGYRSGATVGHAGLVRPRAQLGRAGLQGARLGLGGLGGVLGGQVGRRRRGGRRDGVGAHRRGGRGVLGAHVVVLHALHLALED